MTIQLNLSPELEMLARERANLEFKGDIEAFMQTVLCDYLQMSKNQEDIEHQLLEAIDSPTEPIPDDWCEIVAERARQRKVVHAK